MWFLQRTKSTPLDFCKVQTFRNPATNELMQYRCNFTTFGCIYRARSSAIDFTQLGHQKCFGTK